MISDDLHRFFWDTQPDRLDPEKHSNYIIERLLDQGDLGAIRWLLEAYPKSAVISVLRSSRSLSRKSALFWNYYFNVDPM